MSSHPVNFLLFGPPGAGKSTQMELLRRQWDFVPISTGALLRDEIASGTQLGRSIQATLARGELVSDEVIVPILHKRLLQLGPDTGFLLDGFPRTIPQAQALDRILSELERRLTAVINLELGTSDAAYRLGGRRLCHGSGPDEIIHIGDEAAVARCLERGGTLVQRPDDVPAVIERRLGVYQAQTEPIITYYRPRGSVLSIDASGSARQVADLISNGLAQMQRQEPTA